MARIENFLSSVEKIAEGIADGVDSVHAMMQGMPKPTQYAAQRQACYEYLVAIAALAKQLSDEARRTRKTVDLATRSKAQLGEPRTREENINAFNRDCRGPDVPAQDDGSENT